MGLRWTAKDYERITGKKLPKSVNADKPILADGYAANWKGWMTVGGKHCYFRSLSEYNYACYLQWLKYNGIILDWLHEPETFDFPRLAYKTTPFGYKPDFKVFAIKGGYEWHEVKGWMNPKSKKKLLRFHKHFPEEGQIKVIDSAWFSANSRKLSRLVPGWMSLKEMQGH